MTTILFTVLLSAPPSIIWTALPSGAMIAVECAGDVNGDGTDDVFVASIEGARHGIMCLDGLTGEIIWNDSSYAPGAFNRDCFRSVPDTDLDGITDLAVAIQDEYAVILISGASGDVIWTAPQAYQVDYVESISGPDPGDAAVIITETLSSSSYRWSALDAQGEIQLWTSGTVSTVDKWTRTTEADVSGNGWAEMGYSVDRSSVMNGYVVVRDGYTGTQIGGAGAMYYPTMDITSDHGGILAVSNFGDYPTAWYETIMSGTVIWSSDDYYMTYPVLQFVPNGSSSYYPDLLALEYDEMTLIRGSDGYTSDTYTFPSYITSAECYMEAGIWHAAVSTGSTFHCPELAYISPSIEPSISLPGTGTSDMCLLESDQYPTPLAAVSRTGSGPGACAISTSWPVEIGHAYHSEMIEPGIRLLSNPGHGGLRMYGEMNTDFLVVDLAGRVISSSSIEEGQQMDIELPPGMYLLMDRNSRLVLSRAIVLPE